METRLGNMTQARSIFATGSSVNPNNVRLLHAWAVAESKHDAPDAARKLLHRCLGVRPADGVVWQSLALLEERVGNTPAARAAFQRGSRAAPRCASLWSAWGVLEHRHDRFDDAHRCFERAAAIDPNHVRTYQAWAITSEQLRDYARSEQLFTHALRISPFSLPTYQAYALFAARRGRFDDARRLFEKGVSLDESHAPIWHAWAVMEHGQGIYVRARELFQCGLRADPNNTAILRAWARMELELGHIDRSSDWRVPAGNRARHTSGGKATASRQRKRPQHTAQQLNIVGENLMMLRLILERKSDEDVRAVMTWLNKRANSDKGLYGKLAERQSKDTQFVHEWVRRRSSSDIQAFRSWLEERYENDRRVGVYLFKRDLSNGENQGKRRFGAQTPADAEAGCETGEEAIEEKSSVPTEWFQLADMPAKSLQEFDDELFESGEVVDYNESLYILSQFAEKLAGRYALVGCLGLMALLLAGSAARLDYLDYKPGTRGGQEMTSEGAIVPPPPAGVDAHLYSQESVEPW